MPTRREEVRVTADVSNFISKMGAASGAVRGFATRLEEADGRMSGIVQTGLALAPALVPLGAAAIPAISGLANQLGVAALAAGTAVLAFQGIGDAVKALQAYKLAPTAANFAKLQETFSKIGPAGQEFAVFVDTLTPKLRGLRAVAEAGLFPGVESGLTTLLPLLPRVRELIFSVSSTLGTLIEQGANGLRTSQFRDFFTFLEANASTTLMDLGHTIGSVATGFASLWEAFAPLNASFSSGMASMAASFSDWAAGLSQTQGFQDFLAYIRDTGPEAIQTLGALAGALLQIVEAAAPVGRASLPVITALANVISALADSAVGPTLITIATAVGVLGRSMALLKTVGLTGAGEGIFGSILNTKSIGESAAAIREAAAAQEAFAEAQAATEGARTDFLADPSSVEEYTGALGEEISASEEAAKATDNMFTHISNAGRTFRRIAGVGAGLALATTDIADKFGLANTSSLALIGTMAGPWGAAIGGAIGFAKDLAAANDDLDNSIEASHAAIIDQEGSFTTQGTTLATTQKNFDEYQASVRKGADAIAGYRLWKNPLTDIGDKVHLLKDAWDTLRHDPTDFFEGQSVKIADTTDNIHEQTAAYMTLHQNAAEIYASLNHGSLGLLHANDEVTDSFINGITPALTQAGIDVNKFLASANGSKLRLDGIKAIKASLEDLDAATSNSKPTAVTDALRDIGDNATKAIPPLQALTTALDNVFGVNISQSQATDDWTRSLGAMRKALKDSSGDIHSQSKAAHDARDAMRQYATSAIKKAEADAKADGNGQKFAQTMVDTRDNMIKAAQAAGSTKGEIDAMLKSMNLTPHTLETQITASGVLDSTQKVRALTTLYGLTPRKLHTIVSEAGANPTKKKIKELAAQYHLTPHQLLTILRAEDHASKVTSKAHSLSKQFAKEYKAFLKAKDDGATDKAEKARKKAQALAKQWLAVLKADNRTGPGVRAAQGALNSVHDKTVTITTYYVTKGKPGSGNTGAAGPSNPLGFKPKKKATGGYITGPGTATSDSIPAWLSDGEFVMRAAAVRKYGVANFDRLNAMAFADGGLVARRGFASGGIVNGVVVDNSSELTRVAGELRELRKELKTQRTSKNTRALRRDYASTVAAAYVQDPFSGSLGGFNSQILRESKQLAGAQADLATLKKNGLNGGLFKDLAASGNSALIHQFAGLSKSQLTAEEAAYRHRNNLATNLGKQAAVTAFPSLHELKHEIHSLTKELHDLRHGKKIGNTVTNFNGKISAKDVDALAKKIVAKQKSAARWAKSA